MRGPGCRFAHPGYATRRHYAASTRRNRFHTAVATPDVSTLA